MYFKYGTSLPCRRYTRRIERNHGKNLIGRQKTMEPLNTIKIAIGTDDKVHFSSEHFGSTQWFLIYQFDFLSKRLTFDTAIKNITPEEKTHGDPKKAQNVSNLLPQVSVLVSKYMGSNINKMRKKYIPIITNQTEIQECLKILPTLIPEIQKELQKPMEIPKNVLKL